MDRNEYGTFGIVFGGWSAFAIFEEEFERWSKLNALDETRTLVIVPNSFLYIVSYLLAQRCSRCLARIHFNDSLSVIQTMMQVAPIRFI